MTTPKPIPLWFWKWSKWMLGHEEYKQYGPKNFAHRPGYPVPPRGKMPQWAKDEYRKRFLVPPQVSPTIRYPTPVNGVGAFTAWDCLSALHSMDILDWVAVQIDGRNLLPPDGDGQYWVTPKKVDTLRTNFRKVYAWRSYDHPINPDLVNYQFPLTIGQAEGQGQLDQAETHIENTIITNLFMHPVPARFRELVVETYWNANPRSTPLNMLGEALNRGATAVNLCFGMYDAKEEQTEGRRYTLAEYLAVYPSDPHLVGFSFYLMEHLTPEDIVTLREWRRTHG